MTGFVYRWTNNINKKWYICSHKGSITDRYIGSGRAFVKAIEKYGLENFTREILYEGNDFKNVEISLLNKHDAENDPMSYNLKNNATGGFGTLKEKTFEEIYGKEEAERQKQMRRKTLKGHEVTKKTREIISKTVKNSVVPRTEEEIEKSKNRIKLKNKFKRLKLLVTKRKVRIERKAYNKGMKLGPKNALRAWETKRIKLENDPNYSLKTTRGKTWEEMFGIERAAQKKKEKSESLKGKNSPKKGKTLEKQVGKERAKEIRENQRKARLGKILLNGKLINSNERENK